MDTLTSMAERIFANDLYATEATGITITNVDSHMAECRLALSERHRNARGVAMGGVMFTMADFASAIAANSECLESGDLQWVSLDSNIHFLSPAIGATLAAKCTPIKHGRSTALYQTIVSDAESGRTVAVVETTMMHVGN